MKYFIDFEATQFSGEIISVGCVREDGETFYSLVAPVEGKITPFITNLTGITKEMVETAMSPDSVFEMFHTWVFGAEDGILPQFYVWGNNDKSFIEHTFKRCKNLTARMMLGYIGANIINYASKTKGRLGWGSEHGVAKVLDMLGHEVVQNHNSLDDAILLKTAYDILESTSDSTLEETFLSWKKPGKTKKPETELGPKWFEAGYPIGTICVVNKNKRANLTFPNHMAAADWICETKVKMEQRDEFDKLTCANRILNACKTGKMYHGIKWQRITSLPKNINGGNE